jgi:hypothetical protein
MTDKIKGSPSHHKQFATDRLRLKFHANLTRQSHKPAPRWSYCGMGPAGSEIQHVHDRASDVFLPRENDQTLDLPCAIVFRAGQRPYSSARCLLMRRRRCRRSGTPAGRGGAKRKGVRLAQRAPQFFDQ